MNFKKIILYISLVILLVVAYFGFKVYQIVFTPNTSFSEEKVTVFVPTNANFEEVKAIISPFIKDMDKFETLANRRGYATEVKAGKFELTKNMNTNSIVSALRISVHVQVTFYTQ